MNQPPKRSLRPTALPSPAQQLDIAVSGISHYLACMKSSLTYVKFRFGQGISPTYAPFVSIFVLS
jgi:hypothetical protein